MTETTTKQPASNRADDLQRVKEILFGAEQQRTTDRFSALEQRLERELEQVRSDASANQKQLEQQLAELRSQTEKERGQLAADIEKQITALREHKLDREDLAEMLGGLMTRLAPVAKSAKS